VAVVATDDTACILVKDHGIGIAEAERERIFERFARAVSTSHFGGFGLGLWVTRRIVAAHGGDITVESAQDQGTTFRVSLPRTR
jgi:signal transduction histidine kinase